MKSDSQKAITDAVKSVKQKIQEDAFNGKIMTREQIEKTLIRELMIAHTALGEMIENKVAISALVDSYWARYQEMINSQPELPLENGKEAEHVQ